MKLRFPYKTGDSVKIFRDWENQKKFIGTAKLVERKRFGRSFILKEAVESKQPVYNYEEWIVEWPHTPNPNVVFEWNPSPVHTIEKIRYLDCIGITNSEDDDEYDDINDSKLIIDSFIVINDKQVF